MCHLYLGSKGFLALLKESWLHTLLGNMPRKHRLEEIIDNCRFNLKINPKRSNCN